MTNFLALQIFTDVNGVDDPIYLPRLLFLSFTKKKNISSLYCWQLHIITSAVGLWNLICLYFLYSIGKHFQIKIHGL